MTKEQINKFLTLLMGKEWFEVETLNHKLNIHYNLDFFSDVSFLEYMRWAGEQSWYWSIRQRTLRCFKSGHAVNKYLHKFYTDIKWSLEQQIEWYKKNKKEWGYEKCPECDGQGEYKHNGIVDFDPDGFPVINKELGGVIAKCHICNGTGKIKSKALEYLEEVEG